jgi:hypothetical protein
VVLSQDPPPARRSSPDVEVTVVVGVALGTVVSDD